MSGMKLRALLSRWFQEQVENAPAGDPRRTDECLRFEEIEGLHRRSLKLSPNRAAHVERCEWCQRGLAVMGELSALDGRVPRISTGSRGRWSEKLRASLAAWLRRTAEEERRENVPSPAHFDDEGTLRVHWSGLPVEGRVQLSLVWHDVEVPLTRGKVRHGTLEAVERLPDLGLRSLELPRRALRIEAESRPSAAEQQPPGFTEKENEDE